ncbi:tetratricopeptide repeat protein [Bacillus sp. 2205SS5-2]|uniref:tetratricopeptide repeat protein n=1 Tax=Bacillus sp. 2205SS5-2 TaxID=3109031 RepID=UPI003003B7D4
MKKKRKTIEYSGNVVYFPGIKERLMEKGLDYLQEKKYREAADLLKQALDLGYEQPQIYMALILALYEGEQYEAARDFCQSLLQEGKGEYYEIIDVYLMILIQLNEHQEVVTLLNALFDEQNVPPNKEEHFKQLLSISQKVVNREQLKIMEAKEEELQLFTGDFQEQILVMGQLVHRNIRPYRSQLIAYLTDSNAHPMLQTMVLNVLREHEIDQELSVIKLGEQGKVIPAELVDVFDMSSYQALMVEVEEMVEQKNPSLFSLMKEMISRHSFLRYPFSLSASENVASISYYIHALALIGEMTDVNKMATEMGIRVEEIEREIRKIKKLEEFSSTDI